MSTEAAAEAVLEKIVLFELAAWHSCQLRLRLKSNNLNNLFSKTCSPLACSNMKKGSSSLMFFKNSTNKFKTPTFQNTFCRLFSLQGKNNREGELKCLLHTPLISNAF